MYIIYIFIIYYVIGIHTENRIAEFWLMIEITMTSQDSSYLSMDKKERKKEKTYGCLFDSSPIQDVFVSATAL